MPGRLRITQVRSSISHIARNRATLRALGLRGIGSSVDVPANDATRGMARQVRFLVTVEETAGSVAGGPSGSQGGGEQASESTPVRERTSAAAKAGSRTPSGGEENE